MTNRAVTRRERTAAERRPARDFVYPGRIPSGRRRQGRNLPMSNPIRPLNVEALREQFRAAEPFPHILIDDFLETDFVREVAAAYPDFESSRDLGDEFASLNEMHKVQICDDAEFPDPVRRLNEAISSPEFLASVTEITGIPSLLADAQLRGAGMHLTNTTGRLDVHVDFNYLETDQIFRRLNILIYLNEGWEEAWGGQVELWDEDVKRCYGSFAPVMNRCLIFETSEISFHGVAPVACPPGTARKSFAAYYYTKEPPENWSGTPHSTIFRARPTERFRGAVLMPAQRLRRDRLTHRLAVGALLVVDTLTGGLLGQRAGLAARQLRSAIVLAANRRAASAGRH